MSARPLAAALVALAAVGCTIDTRIATINGDGAAPDAGGLRFATLKAGSPLPDDATCAARLRRSSAEQRPENEVSNHRATTPAEVAKLAPWNAALGYDDHALALQARITGSFTGTTDEILQWTACKWGFDEDHVRAEAFEQTAWTQNVQGDFTETTSKCPPDATTKTVNGTLECAQTYGMMQVVWQYHQSAWPMFRDSTAFHLDFVYAMRRACLEGWDTSQGSRANPSRPYVKDDEWGCLGAHFSGGWYDANAKNYIERVQGQLAGRGWTKLGM